MGYVYVLAPCGACQVMITFNPMKVPSLQGLPICRSCVERWKKIHGKPFDIPNGAYEPMPEEELPCD